jgi:hypothetical protein
MHQIHPQARTTPSVRAEIAGSTERTGEERAIVCHLRRAPEFGLNDLTFMLRHFLHPSPSTETASGVSSRMQGSIVGR